MALLAYGRMLLVCCCHLGVLTAAVALLGVEPGSEKRYAGPDFRCSGFDGSALTLTPAAINDDSCDCVDGSDEPGTGACAGKDTTLFFCANKGSTARRIYASRVGDGLCDCCDGSDEAMLAKRFPASACPDTCAQEGAAAKAEGEKKAVLLRAALDKQAAIRQAGLKDRETWRGELDKLNSQLTNLQAALDEAKVAADVERAAEEEKRKAEEAAKEAARNASGASLCMWRQTGGCLPSGERESHNDKPCTEFIVAGSSGYCDCDGDGVQGPEETGYTCEASSGHSCEQVCAKADATESAPTEESTAVEEPEKPQVSEYSKWMDGAAETLSKTEQKEEKQVSEYTKWMEGAEAATGGAEAAPDATADDLDENTAPPAEPEEPAPTDQKKSAIEVETEARRELDSHQELISEVQSKLDSIASDEHLVFADLSEKTLKKHISEWDYKIEFFKKAEQDHTSLGTWSKWTGRTTAEFERGTMCWGGPARKLNVKFECALEAEIVDVFEPSRCVYEATVKHPGACDPAELDRLTTGLHVIGPRDEL